MDLDSGTNVGPYQIVAPIGAGAMGCVYRARDPRLARDIAIKVIAARFSSDEDAVRRFTQEARAAAALAHPSILAVHDVGVHEGAPYIVSELLTGGTLRERLTDARPHALDIRKASAYAVQLAGGLAAAHDKGIFHRDLKPENVFVTRDGQIKILDFGVAKLAPIPGALVAGAAAPTSVDTEPGLFFGTIGYCAPEQLHGQPVDHRADIFAFGIILYEMLTGRSPFPGRTPADAVSAMLERDPEEVPGAGTRVPDAFTKIIERCLEKDPAARFQSTRDLAFTLQTLATIVGGASPVRPRKLSRFWIVAGTIALALVAVAIIGASLVRTPAGRPQARRFEIPTPPTDDPVSFAVSADGRQLIYVATVAGTSQLWLRAMDAVEPRPITGTDGASYPFWSPDARSIGFFSDGKLKRVSLDGGPPQALAVAPIGRGGAWNRDGIIIFAPTSSGGLSKVAATGGPATPLTEPTGSASHRYPQFVGGSRKFIFLSSQGPPESRGIYVASIDGSAPRRILPADTSPAYTSDGYLLTVAGTALMAYRFDPVREAIDGEPLAVAQPVGTDVGWHGAFSVSDEGTLVYRSTGATRRQLTWVDRSGTHLGTLGPVDQWSLASPELAPDGRTVAVYRNPQQNVDVWLLDVARGTTTRLTTDSATDSGPVWSPDGRRIFFRSTRKGKFDIYEKSADGAADERPIFVSSQNKAPQQVSPDGRTLLFTTDDATNASDLWALPLTAGGGKPVPVVATPFDEVQGQFSPDGRWLAYASNETGRYEVYLRSFLGTGGRISVSNGGGLYPRWRADGRELFYVTPDNHMMAAVVNGDASPLTTGAPTLLFAAAIAMNGNVGTGGFGSKAQYAVAADGRFLLNVSAEAVAAPLNVVLNWRPAQR